MIGEGEECTSCAEERHKVIDIAKSQAHMAEQHDQVCLEIIEL
jgi:hypothetical protein